MYSWAGQLYTDLRTGCQGIKGTSAGLTGFSGIKNAYRGPRKTIAYEAHEWTLMQWGVLYDDNIDNGAYYIRHLARKMATASCPQKVVPVVVTKIDTLIDLGEDECLEGTTPQDM